MQPISFTAKQRFEQRKPHVSLNNAKTNSITLSAALKKHDEKIQLESMVQEAKQALQAVSAIQNASKSVLQNGDKIVEKSDEVQQKAQMLMAKIVDTGAYQRYCLDSRIKRQAPTSSYIGKIKLQDEIYDIKITADKITATKRVLQDPYQAYVPTLKTVDFVESYGKDVFEFDTKDRQLSHCVINQKKIAYVSALDEEYYFNNGRVSKVNLGVSKGEFDLTNQSFVFEDDFLTSFSSKILETKGKTTIDRHFEYNPVGVLSRFSRGYAMDDLDTIERELEYSFSNDELKTFRKDFVESPSYWGSKIFAQFENENDFYVEANSDSNDSVGYKGICFYKNGKIEGSVVQ